MALVESWNSDHLELVDYDYSAGSAFTETGRLHWSGLVAPGQVVTVTKWFEAGPGQWGDTVLMEELTDNGVLQPPRPVQIFLEPSSYIYLPLVTLDQ